MSHFKSVLHPHKIIIQHPSAETQRAKQFSDGTLLTQIEGFVEERIEGCSEKGRRMMN